MQHLIEAHDVVKVYKGNGVETTALDHVSFTIEPGSFTIILGPSGAGKTTLLNVIGGMDDISSGTLKVADQDLSQATAKQLTLYRRNKIGFVFQFYNLMPNLTAEENVELAVEVCKNAYNPAEMLKKVGLSDKLNSFPSQLSGGEQQRVSIARAVAKNPELLLCDEPTGALDYETGKGVLKLLFDMCRSEKKAVIIVTHNAALKEMGDRVIHIRNGHITEIVNNSHPKPIEEIEW